jgi:hypothetical protein
MSINWGLRNPPNGGAGPNRLVSYYIYIYITIGLCKNCAVKSHFQIIDRNEN